MSTKNCQPAVYGQLRADYLKKVSKNFTSGNFVREEEHRRQELLKEIREGKLKK